MSGTFSRDRVGEWEHAYLSAGLCRGAAGAEAGRTPSVTGSAGSFSVTFAGTHANLNVSQIFGEAANSTAGTTSRTITTAYNAASEITSVTDPDSTITYTRDALGRATTVSNVIAGLTPTVALTQVLDAMSNRTELAATVGGTADFKNTYTFDALQRMTDLLQQGQSGGNAVTAKHVAFAYNALGKRRASPATRAPGRVTPSPQPRSRTTR